MTNNDNSAPINPDGLVTAGRSRRSLRDGPLRHVDRRQPGAGAAQERCPTRRPRRRRPTTSTSWSPPSCATCGSSPAPICSDEVFLRRATIDITGLLPTVDEYQAFVGDADPAKRAKLVDRLLARKEFSEIWAMKWANLLMIKSTGNEVSEKSAFLYANWLTNQISNNVPLDQMVRELLGASGGTFKNPPTNYYQVERDTLKTAENVAQVFMGIRIQCAQCHNHPFDRWTMDDYYSFAAFFSQVGRKRAEDYRELIIFNSARRRSRPSGRRPADAAQVSGRRGGRRGGQGPPRRAGRMADLGRESLLRHQRGQPRVGPFLRHRHRGTGRRHSRQQSGQQSRNCSPRWAAS